MLHMKWLNKWLNLLLAALLIVAPLQIALAQTGPQAQAVMAMQGDGAENGHAMHHAGYRNSAGAPAQQGQANPPCGQHKGPCLACGLCGAHCAAPIMHYELSPRIGHCAVTVAPPLIADILSPPPPGEPPRFFLS